MNISLGLITDNVWRSFPIMTSRIILYSQHLYKHVRPFLTCTSPVVNCFSFLFTLVIPAPQRLHYSFAVICVCGHFLDFKPHNLWKLLNPNVSGLLSWSVINAIFSIILLPILMYRNMGLFFILFVNISLVKYYIMFENDQIWTFRVFYHNSSLNWKL